jgi:hypothetical protein
MVRRGHSSEIGNQLLQNVPLEPYSYILAPLKEQKPFVALIRDIPDADLRGILETQQVQSLLVIPLYITANSTGLWVRFLRHERVWTETRSSAGAVHRAAVQVHPEKPAPARGGAEQKKLRQVFQYDRLTFSASLI